MKTTFVLISMALAFSLNAQDDSSSNLNVNDNLFLGMNNAYNPAFTGINGSRADYGIFHSNFRPLSYTRQEFNGEFVTKNQKNAFGINAQTFGSALGFTTNYRLSYARRFQLKNGHLLSLAANTSLATGHFSRLNQSNPLEIGENVSLNSSIGASYKTKNLRLGASTSLPRYLVTNNEFNTYNPNLILNAAYNVKLGESFNFIPKIEVGMVWRERFGLEKSLAISGEIMYKNKFSLAVSGLPLSPFRANLTASYFINDKLRINASTLNRFGPRGFGLGVTRRF